MEKEAMVASTLAGVASTMGAEVSNLVVVSPMAAPGI
jgi:hypothetical protein